MFIRLAYRGHRVPQDYKYEPTVTVLMSCFNEGKAVYDTIKYILESDYPKDKITVIAVDDCSKDDSWVWMQNIAKLYPNVMVFRNTENKGKAHSLLFAFEKSDSELILIIDSDGELDKNAIKELTSCFFNPVVGGVGGCVRVRNASDNWLTQMQTLQYNSVFQLAKVGETFTGSVSCISGAIFMLRSSIYNNIQADIKTRTWLGYEVKEGEDRFMTNLILHLGYKTIVNNKAKVFTDVPNNFKQFFSQQLRWRRGFCRILLWSVKPTIFIKNVKTLKSIPLFRLYFLSMLAFIAPALITWLLISSSIEQIIFMKLQLLVLFSVVHGINYITAKMEGSNISLGTLAFIMLPLWILIDMTIITAISIFTLTSVSWETRTLK